jgi:hypothetical protein
LKDLPADLKRDIIPRIASGKPGQVVRGNYTAAAINKQFNALMNSPERIVAILDSLPYTANGIDVVECLKNKSATLPVMQSMPIKVWLTTAKAKLVHGQELHLAIENNNQHRIDQLLCERNIDINHQEYGQYCAALAVACASGDTGIVRQLLAAGANVELKDGLSQTPIHIASLKGHEMIVRLLIAAGANANTKDWSRSTPLMGAAQLKDIGIAEMLLNSGADPAAKNCKERSAVDYARGHHYNRSMEYLLENAIEEHKAKQSKKS